MKKIIFLFLIFSLICINTTFVKAESLYLSIDINQINDPILKDNINSLYFEKINDEYCLYINNIYVKENGLNRYEIALNSYLDLIIYLDEENKTIKIDYNHKNVEIIQSKFVFHIDQEGNQLVLFYPLKDEKAYEERKAFKSDDFYDFGVFNASINGNDISFKLKVDTINDVACLTKDGVSYYQSLSEYGADRVLYFEQLFYGREVEMDYMKKDLEMVDFKTAQVISYSSTQIDNAVSNEKLVLVNATTNNTYEIDLCRTITQWERVKGADVGTGEYEEKLVNIQVVCQYNDPSPDCDDIRKSISIDERLYAVWGDEIEYQIVDEGDVKIVEKEVKTIKYKNISWPTNSFHESSEIKNQNDANYYYETFQNKKDDYGIIEFKKANGIWGSYSSYKNDVEDECDNDDCQIKLTKFYKYQIRNWTNWTKYIFDSCVSNEKTQCKNDTLYRYSTRKWSDYSDWSSINKCDLFDDECKDEQKIFYSKSTRYIKGYDISWGIESDTKYGDYQNECKSRTVKNAPCSCKRYNSSGTLCGYSYSDYAYYSYLKSIGKYDCLYIKAGIHKGEYFCASTKTAKVCKEAGCSEYNTCTIYSCPTSKNKIYSTWGTYSNYDLDNCQENELTKCKSITKYRKSTLSSWSNWSMYSYTIDDIKWTECAKDSNCKQEGKIQYSKRYLGDYSEIKDEELLYCPASDDNTEYNCIDITKYQTRYRTWQSWSNWQYTNNEILLSQNEKIKYRYSKGIVSFDDVPYINGTYGHDNTIYSNEKKSVITLKEEEVVNLVKESRTIGLLSKMKKSDINKITSKIENNIIYLEIYNKLSNGGYNDVSVSDFKKAKITEYNNYINDSHISALNIFENKAIFIPYFYIRTHWRVLRTTVHVSGYENESIISSSENISEITGEEEIKLLENPIEIDSQTKIIYFNYQDPLINNDNELYEAYKYFIEMIKSTNVNLSKATITISKNDMKEMKKWISQNYVKSSKYDFVKEFIYIFDLSTQELIKERVDK